MQSKTLALAAALTLALSGTTLAQTPSGGGSAEGNMNNPGSVKSNSEKAMERSTGTTTGTTTGTGMAPAAPGAATGGSMGTGTGAGSTGAGGAAGGR
ncbi:hypothetical protein H0176_25550 [Methylorubrum populi]|uniref:hypothetical protein n=1 Tax=Methylorubrum rhodesianum TaxID=29427 RepID=UPI000477DD9A|nr:hypothetical protein [Methylorubrum rhodesianum]MBK3401595.1 hypothetical protein [Methylorubrum rhodesianum]MBY0143598.1 hypothetical protein [Methylorubrum populi]